MSVLVPGEPSSARSRSRAKQLRLLGQLLVTVLVLGAFAGLAGGGYYLLRNEPADEGTPTCTSGSAAPLLGIRVINSTSRPLLARRTGDQLIGRAFEIKGVGNSENPVAGSAQIRYPRTAVPTARVLARHVPGAVLLVDPKLTDEVDLILGAKFRGLRPAADVAKITRAAPKPSPVRSCA